MSSKLRLLLVLGCCLLIAGGIGLAYLVPRGGSKNAARAGPVYCNKDCRECHEAVWLEWEASYHRRSWSDPHVQAAFQHFGYDRKCQSCHAPEPVVAIGSAEPHLRDEATRDSGVNCLSCHQLPQGRGVAAVRTIADAPCKPVQHTEMTNGKLCGRCHDAIHDDWINSRYSKEQTTCQSCHMPAVASRQHGRSHICLGGHDVATVRSGVQGTCRQQGEELVVSITNHATGHNFPGERHNRVLLLEVVERAEDDRITLVQQDRIKEITPFRGESSADRIRAGDTYTARFPVVDDSAAADVRLIYKPFPWYADRDSILVYHEQLKLVPGTTNEHE
jgi:hypothetical protein